MNNNDNIIIKKILNDNITNVIEKNINNELKSILNKIVNDIIKNTVDEIKQIQEKNRKNTKEIKLEQEQEQKLESESEIEVCKINSWANVINDKSYIYKNRKVRIFPVLKNKLDYSKLKIDEESFNYITIREIADFTSKVICHHLINDFLNPLRSVVCDLTAGVGGNTLSFSNYFSQVHAVEIVKDRYDDLINNSNVYKCKNISFYNSCAIKFINEDLESINPSVLFIDPPWGGVDYKKSESLELSLGDVSLEDLLIMILNKFSVIYNSCNKNLEYSSEHNKLVIFKLPKNYNIVNFYKYIKSSNSINNYIVKNYLYIFNKMVLLVCHCVYINYQIIS
jgi:tRNA/tmRNA/rRNA uracil-C5-methylase (TrmA/RlmC/RlmD family)